MDKLGQKAELGNDVSIAQFMEYIMDIKKRLDITSNDKQVGLLNFIQDNELRKNNSNQKDTDTQEED